MIFTAGTTRVGAVGAALAGAALALSACAAEEVESGEAPSSASASSGGGEVVIGGPEFTEGAIMTQMYAGVLDDAGYDTSIVTVGNRELYFDQLSQGQIQVVPDYLGTLTEYMNTSANGPDAEVVASSDTQETLTVAEELAQQYGIELLEPAQAQTQNSFAVTEDFATQNNLETLSDLGALGQPVILAATEECPERPFCAPGLQEVYDIQISSITPTGFDTAATKQEVANGDAQLGLVATTDATLDQFGLVQLEDDMDLQQAENLVPAVNESVAGDTTLVEALNELSQTLTTEDLAGLNAQVDDQRELPEDVARQYLEDNGLVG